MNRKTHWMKKIEKENVDVDFTFVIVNGAIRITLNNTTFIKRFSVKKHYIFM